MFETSSNSQPNSFSTSFNHLNQEIDSHQQRDKSESYLGKAFDFIWRGDENSMKAMQQLSQDAQKVAQTGSAADQAAMAAKLDAAVKHDQSEIKIQDNVTHYGSSLVKVGALFFGGKAGYAAAGALFAADQARPTDNLQTQLIDGTLGAAKGLATKGAVGFLGGQDWNFALKGAAMGSASRLIDSGLTRQNYLDNYGDFNALTGAKNVLSQSLNPAALATDVATFGAAYGMGYGLSKIAGTALDASPLLRTVSTGGTFGFASGAANEVNRELSAHENLNVGNIALHGVLDGLVYSAAAVPGGVQAESAAAAQAAARAAQPKLTPEQTTQLYDQLKTQQGGSDYNFEKRLYQVDVQPAEPGQHITTIKGDVETAKAGDNVVTNHLLSGQVDQYLIGNEKLVQRWQPAGGQQPGEPGLYTPKPGGQTPMVELKGPTNIDVSWAKNGVNGDNGDFLAMYGPGDYNIVHKPALAETYQGVDPASKAMSDAAMKSVINDAKWSAGWRGTIMDLVRPIDAAKQAS